MSQTSSINTGFRIPLENFGRSEATANTTRAGDASRAPSLGQRIGDAFKSFGNKIADAFSAFKEKVGSELGALANSYREWKAERSEQAAIARETRRTEKLDKADAAGGTAPSPLTGKNPGAGLNTTDRAQMSRVLTALMSDINSAVAANTDPTKSAGDVRQDALVSLLQKSAANTLAELDTSRLDEMASQFRAEGRTEKADLLGDLSNLVKSGRTPDGAERLYGELANREMGVNLGNSPNNFLRTTSNEGTAAVRKLMQANGSEEYQNQVSAKLAEMASSPEAIEIGQRMKDENVQNATHDMSKELARDLAAFSLKLADAMLSVPLPDAMVTRLDTLSTEIGKRGDGIEDTLRHQLFSDQIMLKANGPLTIKGQPDVIKVAGDMINKVANQAKSGSKYTPETLSAFNNVAPQLNTKIETFLVASGMPQSAVKTW